MSFTENKNPRIIFQLRKATNVAKRRFEDVEFDKVYSENSKRRQEERKNRIKENEVNKKINDTVQDKLKDGDNDLNKKINETVQDKVNDGDNDLQGRVHNGDSDLQETVPDVENDLQDDIFTSAFNEGTDPSQFSALVKEALQEANCSFVDEMMN